MRRTSNRVRPRLLLMGVPLLPILSMTTGSALGQMITKTENFNVDPGWDGHNNRSTFYGPATVTENYGYGSNRVGGTINPTGEISYFAQTITSKTFNDTLTASGTLRNDGGGNSWLQFFNDGTINEWRSANSLGLRIYGRGSYFLAYPEYGTSKWRAGANGFVSGGNEVQFPTNTDLNWSLSYNPAGNGGGGTITATINGITAVKDLDAGHKADTASFNRFGLGAVNKSWDSPGQVFIDNVNVNGGGTQTFTGSAPGWGDVVGGVPTAVNNVANYQTNNVRFRFDFGYSNTHNISGGTNGEVGGNFFRGDSRQASSMAFYGGPLDQTLNLTQPLHAHGKLTFKRGVTDSTVLLGFFHNTDSIRVSAAQAVSTPEDFVGAIVEGPSSEGFNFYPGYNTDTEGQGGSGRGTGAPPYIYPNSAIHDWTLDYDPNGAGGLGQVTVSLDGQQQVMPLQSGHKAIGAHFNRFGFVTTQIDGNGQTVFIDDVTYTVGFGSQSQWLPDASGNWHSATNWSSPAVPNAVGAQALFGNNNTAGRTVFANSATTVGTITFNSPNTWLLAGLGSLTMQVSSGTAQVIVQQGTHRINLPFIIASNTQLSVSSGTQLIISDPVTVNAGKSLTKTGTGTVTYQSLVTVQPGGSISLSGASELNAGVALASDAKMDVASSVVIGGSDYQTLNSRVTQGFNGGDWRGNGITSLAAANDPRGATALGLKEDGDAVLVKYTYYGDADLSGLVDVGDFESFRTSYKQKPAAAVWVGGDFDFSGSVDLADFDRMLIGIAAQPGRASGDLFSAVSDFVSAEGLNVDLTALPEPAGVGMLAAAALLLRRRRRIR